MTHVRILLAAAALCGASGAALAAEQTQWDGVYTPAQAARGKEVYEKICINCHAPTMTGGQQGPALVGEEFVAKWDGFTLGEIFERIKTTMPQSDPGTLTAQMVADVLGYILQYARYAPGTAELPPKMDKLDEFWFRAEKPGG